MSKPVLAVDVDITTLASDVAWYDWLTHMCYPSKDPDLCVEGLSLPTVHTIYNFDGGTEYNLATYFGEPKNSRVKAVDFWRGDSLFDTVVPVEGAVEAITSLSEWMDIVFLTHVKGAHSRSKYNCLERHFGHIPFDYVITKEKHRVAADAIVDDRNEFINQFLNKDRVAIKFNTPYIQYSEIDSPKTENYGEANGWDEVVKKLGKFIPF